MECLCHPKPLDEDNRLKKLLENSYEAICLLNETLEISYSSPSFEQVTGFEHGNLKKDFRKGIITSEDLQTVNKALYDAVHDPGVLKSCFFWFTNPSKDPIWLEGCFTNMQDDPDIGAILCRFRDVTRATKVNQLLDQTHSALLSYQYALDKSSIVTIVDDKGTIEHVNDNFCSVLQYERDELVGSRLSGLDPSFDKTSYLPGMRKTLLSGNIWEGEIKNKAKDGSFFWLQASIVPFLNGPDKPCKFIAICCDITAGKLKEETRKKEQQRLKLLESVITNTKDAILITEAGPQSEPGPKILYVNEAFTRMTGYSADEVLGKSPRMLQGPKTDRDELKRLRLALENWETCEITVINYKKNGDEFWINFSVTPVANENGWFTHWISVERDVTESRNLEAEYNQIFHHAPDIICTVGLDGYFKKVNPAMSLLLGYSQEELLSRRIVRFVHPDDQCRIMKEIEIKNKTQKTFYFENRCLSKTGQIKWLGWTCTPPTRQGLVFTVAKDITEKKELENLLDNVTRLAMIGGWFFDLVSKTVYWSELTKAIHEVEPGYEPDLEKAVNFYNQTANSPFLIEQIGHAVQSGTAFDTELQILTARQNLKWVRFMGEPELEKGVCVRIKGSYQDIDIRKKAELALNQTLEEKSIILESIGDAFFAVDTNWIVTYWNKKAEEVLQKTREQTSGFQLWDLFADAVGSVSYHRYHQAADQNHPVQFEDYYPPLKRWFDISVYPSADGLSVYFKDVTGRKIMDAALQESERNYSALFHLSPLPMWVCDLTSLCFLDINAAAINNYGYSRDEFLSMNLKDLGPAEHLAGLEQMLSDHHSSFHEMVNHGVFRQIKKNGDIMQVQIQSNIIQYKQKSAKIMIAHDMTRSYMYTKAIEQQNTKLREIAWMQSHLVRAPLARIMGIVPMVRNWESYAEERETLLDYLLVSAHELDQAIKDISEKTSLVEHYQL